MQYSTLVLHVFDEAITAWEYTRFTAETDRGRELAIAHDISKLVLVQLRSCGFKGGVSISRQC